MTLPVVSSSPVLRIAALFIMTSDSYSGYQKNRTRKIYAGEARNGLVKTSIFTDRSNGLCGVELGLRQRGKLDQVGLRLVFEELLQGGLNAFFGGKIYTERIYVLLILVKFEM